MDITAVFVDNLNDQCLMQRLLPERKGLLFFGFDLLDAGHFNCKAIIICHRLSAQSPFPRFPIKYNTSRLVVLSDCSQEETIVESLRAGAHHYIDLHASEQELTARVSAALRCHLQRDCRTLDIEPYKFNLDNRTVSYENCLLDLSPREFELAYYLFSNRNRTVTDSELMRSVWTLPPTVDTRRIDTSICRIKKKMKLNRVVSKWKIARFRQEGYQVTC